MPRPGIFDTFLVRGPVHLYNITVARLLNKQTPEHIAWEANGDLDQEPQDGTDALLQAAIPPNANGEARKRKSRAKS